MHFSGGTCFRRGVGLTLINTIMPRSIQPRLSKLGAPDEGSVSIRLGNIPLMTFATYNKYFLTKCLKEDKYVM